MSHEKEYLKEEIRKEFQLERMVLFSDAVFAIAITLMAMDIKAPEEQPTTTSMLLNDLRHVVPVIIAYTSSFIFIGITWYKHLQLFSLLKDYNKGVVVRNLAMLFFVGLFPFGASVIAKGYTGTMAPIYIYIGIVLCCAASQHILQHYILVKHPELCIRTDISHHLENLAKSRASFIILGIIISLVVITALLIPNDAIKPISAIWFAIFPLLQKLFRKKEKKIKKVTAGAQRNKE